MAPSRSAEPLALAPSEQRQLLSIGREAIRRGLAGERDWSPTHEELTAVLTLPAATFVTLRRDGDLLGCIGSMEPQRALADDVAANAVGAAFGDPRLPSVTASDFEAMAVKVSVLGALVPVDVVSIDQLAATVRVGVDGLFIVDSRRRATFLPSVWEQVPDAASFLGMLWQKAGLRDAEWPRRLEVFRYETVEFSES